MVYEGDKCSAESGTKGFKLCYLGSIQGIFVYTLPRRSLSFAIGEPGVLTERGPVFPRHPPGLSPAATAAAQPKSI
jgi:hypothetical protein